MLLHFAPNSTLFTSLLLTIGLTYGLLMLTILSLTLSRGLLFSKWAFCWRYTLVMISISLFCLAVSNFSASAFSLSSVRVSFSVFPKRLSRRPVSFLVWTFVCLRRFLYDRLAFSTSTYFVLGRCTRFPGSCQYLLLLLDLQPAGQLRKHAVQKFVVRQRMHRVYSHIAEEPIVDVAVKMLHQLWAAQTCVPAQTEAIRPLEDCILLHRFIKATWLLKEKNQKSLWRDFMAYTECTSLIGTPSIDGVQQSIRAHMHFQKIVTFVLTVGLSGFLLLAVQQCHKGKEKDYSPLIEQTNKGI